jgi:predicted signal transduction protein with EAL and GGDEF domain
MRVALPERWSARLNRTDRWLPVMRPLAAVVVLLGVAASVWIAEGWHATVTRQRDERLDRTAASRTVTTNAVLAQVSTLYQRVGRLAVTDGLTGVANRRVWDQELPRALARSARSGGPLCVALIDLDRFKAFNDQHGHQAGDRLLKARRRPGRTSSVRPTCWSATVGRSSRCCCPTADSRTPWRSPAAC